MTIILAVLASLCAGSLIGCAAPEPPRLTDARRSNQGFVNLLPRLLPNTRVDLVHARSTVEPTDSGGIEMILYRGEPQYLPVNMCHRANELLNAFRETGDTVFLQLSRKYIHKLQSMCVEQDSALFVQHFLNYYLHGDNGIHLVPPWVSGMAQGEFLGLLVRLFEFTGDSSHLSTAKRVFNSLLRLEDQGRPWVARIDPDGYYWLEEFPHEERPGMTLNGYIAAVFGVYDYYRVTGDSTALLIYEASLTTIKHYLPQFRRPGESSFYCLGHRHPANLEYHNLHISMCQHLYRMTNDEFFRTMADELSKDTAPRQASAED